MLLAMGCLSWSAATLAASEVGLAGSIGSKALLSIDGAPPQAVGVGQSLGGVKVISVSGEGAVIELDGKRRSLRPGQGTGNPQPPGSNQSILTADSRGHFYATGFINGAGTVRFMVDTGATMVVLGQADARRLGIDPGRGQMGTASTANGTIMVSKVVLDHVRVGDITLFNVDCMIHQSELPVALLGMSFLSRLEMKQDGNSLFLKKRF